MLATIIMDENKELRKTTTPTIYQQENNADKILVLLPQYYGDLSLKDCSVTLNWIQPSLDNQNSQLSGNIKQLDFESQLYNDIYLQAITPITTNETSVSGEIELFLTIVDSTGVDMKTGSAFLEVKPHKKITDYVNNTEIELLSDYLIKMQQLNNTCNQTLQLATEQAERAEQSANLIIQLMQEWEVAHKP